MSSFKSRAVAIAAAATLAGGIGAIAAASTAHATTPLVSASTTITNDGDSGGGGIWADDDFTRTLTINTDTAASDCAGLGGFTSADVCYSATAADTGNANTIVNAFQPNQGINPDGLKITGPSEAVPFTGTADYQFYAPTGDVPSAANVQSALNDNFTHPSSGAGSTSQWYLQAFTPGVRSAVVGALGNWSFKYADSCESWTDANTNNSGQSTPLGDDGNITGKVCPAPAPSPTGTATTTPPPASVTGMISSFTDYSKSCLDNSGFTWADGNPLQLWTCGASGGADQQFTFATVGGKQVLEAVAPAGKPAGPWCVTAPVNGSGRLVIDTCDPARIPGQVISKQGPEYVFAGDGGYVMDDRAWNAGNGAEVIAYAPNGGRNQHWSLP